MSDSVGSTDVIHATCVASGDAAVLIQGRSGSGKSALGLQLLAFGAELVSDDQTVIRNLAGVILASSPETIRGQIEARGIGILAARFRDQARVRLIVDMDQTEEHRLPKNRYKTVLGCKIPVIHQTKASHFPASVLQFLKGGRIT